MTFKATMKGRTSGRCKAPDTRRAGRESVSDNRSCCHLLCEADDEGCSGGGSEEIGGIEAGPDGQAEDDVDEELVGKGEPEVTAGLDVECKDPSGASGRELNRLEGGGWDSGLCCLARRSVLLVLQS